MKKTLTLFVVLSLIKANMSWSQSFDSSALITRFISVCNDYKKKTPLFLRVGYQSRSNFITSSEDTTTIQGEFHILANSAYMRFGDIEEIVTDSIALLVSDRTKKMTLFTHATPVLEKMKSALGAPIPVSTLDQWNKKFLVSASIAKDMEEIELSSRSVIGETGLHRETIKLTYDPATNQPLIVENIKRSLIPLEKNDFDRLTKELTVKPFLISLNEQYFVVKEQVMSFSYYEMSSKNDSSELPVRIEARVAKDKNRYMPVKGYESYVLNQQ